MIDAALKARGIRAWFNEARRWHDEANRWAFDCNLPESLRCRRKAFAAERNAKEWRSYQITPSVPLGSTAQDDAHSREAPRCPIESKTSKT
jgi:hypothetical protein